MSDPTPTRTPPPGATVMTLEVAPLRRALGAGSLAFLGVLLVWLAISLPAALGFRVGLLLIGVLALWGTVKLWEASRMSLTLTRERLTDSEGRVLAELGGIAQVARGALALKPSNGFVLVMKTRQPRGWAPGVWWRLGRRVGVGGLTSAGGARAMAEVIEALLVERAAAGPGAGNDSAPSV